MMTARTSPRPPFAWRAVVPVALAQFVVPMAFADRYGYHRDELYFRVAARHPSVAYDDQGALTPLLGRLSEALFGETPRGLRVFSAVLASLVVIIVALVARELGARVVGQLVAGLGAATSGYLLAVGHLLTTSTLDALVWTTALLLVTRILAGGDERLWIAVGIAFAVGLENKALPLLLALAIAIGLLLDRRLVAVGRSPWLWGGVAVAVVGWLPWLVWQARHGWPQLELTADIRHDDGTENRVTLIPLQLVLLSPLLAPIIALGLWGLLRDSSLRLWRSLGYAYIALLALVFVTAGKPYYAAPVLLFLLAPGSTVLERWLNTARRRAALAIVLAVSAAMAALVVLPILPADRIGGTPISALNEDAIETIGWPRLVRTVADVYAGLPDIQRRSAVVFAANYGEAGAIDRYGGALGLPRAYSAHNAFARFGIPPDDNGPVVVLGYHHPATDFSGCRRAATIDNGADVDNEEQGGLVFVCAKPRAPWARLWNQINHLDA